MRLAERRYAFLFIFAFNTISGADDEATYTINLNLKT